MDLAAIRERHMRRIAATTAVEAKGGGSQRRSFVQCGDDVYQLKLGEIDPPELEHKHRWVLFNELLGVTFAALLDLHVAPSALIDVPTGMLCDNSHRPVEPGTHFGSHWLDGFCELEESRLRPDAPASFQKKLYTLLAFDTMILNGDRKHRDLLYVRGSDPDDGAFLIVDHGNALCGSDWWADHLDAHHSTRLDPAQVGWIYRYLTDKNLARSAMRRIADALSSSLPTALEMVFDAQADAQPQGILSEKERKAVGDVLTARVAQVEHLADLQVDRIVAYLDSHKS